MGRGFGLCACVPRKRKSNKNKGKSEYQQRVVNTEYQNNFCFLDTNSLYSTVHQSLKFIGFTQHSAAQMAAW